MGKGMNLRNGPSELFHFDDLFINDPFLLMKVSFLLKKYLDHSITYI